MARPVQSAAGDIHYLTGDGTWIAANFVPAAIPVAGDVAVIPGNLGNPVTDASGNADAADMAGVYVHRNYVHDFGSSGTGINLAATFVKLFSSGNCYLNCDDLGAAGDIDDLFIALGRPTLVAEIGGDAGAPGEIDRSHFARGRITLKSSIVWPAGGIVNVGYVNSPADDCFVVIESSAPTLPVLNIGGGKVTAKNAVTTAVICNGKLIQTHATLANATVMAGGTLEYEFAEASGTNDIHVMAGGLLDLLTTLVPKDFGLVTVDKGGEIRYDPDIHTFSEGLYNANEGVL